MPSGKHPLIAYVAVVTISDHVLAKIGSKHGISEGDVWEAVHASSVLRSAWVEDERGSRLLVVGQTARGRSLRLVLYPAGDGVWRLGTAMPA